jgi:hypothetical protein
LFLERFNECNPEKQDENCNVGEWNVLHSFGGMVLISAQTGNSKNEKHPVKGVIHWLRERDSNPRPPGYGPGELPTALSRDGTIELPADNTGIRPFRQARVLQKDPVSCIFLPHFAWYSEALATHGRKAQAVARAQADAIADAPCQATTPSKHAGVAQLVRAWDS